jgi:uncharacterized tellurite resistance protein B-like protein
LTRGKLKALAAALGGVGLGMEPDLRFGGSAPSFESRVILFADDPATATAEPSPRYVVAALTLQLAAAIAGADGTIADAERALMVEQINSSLSLTESERRRLNALLRLVLIEPPKVSGLKRKMSALDPGAREAVADFLVNVARADDKITPEEIRTLQKAFEALGLDSERVFSKVHVAEIIRDSVVDRAADAGTPRSYAIPRPPEPVRMSKGPRKVQGAPNAGISLDSARVAASQRESDRVARILAPLFAESASETLESQNGGPVAPGGTHHTEATLLGLDHTCSAFLRILLAKPEWTQGELAQLARDRGVMLGGMLERLNEASYDKLDMPLFDDGDPLVLNQEAVVGVSSECHPQS